MKVDLSITRTFVAEHSLPVGGMEERHEHSYELTCGYSADVDPALGRRKTVQELGAPVDAIVGQLSGQFLNAVLPVPPTAEMLACWVLAQLPAEWEWASIRAYDGFTCRVRREDILESLGLLRE